MVPVLAGALNRRGSGSASVHAFCIDMTEVTTAGYKACADSGACRPAGQRNEWPNITPRERDVLDPLCNARAPEDRGKHPINCISFEMAETFCKAMGKRLPTESEWLLAALGPDDARPYPWGTTPPDPTRVNGCGRECTEWGKRSKVDEEELYPGNDGYPTTAPVGSFPEGKSPSGALDMFGNVWEWVDAVGRREDQRILRGGAWNASSLGAPSTRTSESMERRSYSIGFRCAKN
jgi:formylglycine-generating enzyme required for sulfatase activity